MAATSKGKTELHHINSKSRERETSPERAKVWTESAHSQSKTERKVPVLYYLSRNGHLQHPHFMEVPLASNEGLFLRDVMNRMNHLRGKGMANMYSWSSKRSYKNGYVWQDLSENDFIYPAHGNEYVLKGSELLERSVSFRSIETSSSSSEKQLEGLKMEGNSSFPVVRRRNQSWSSIDLNEYKVYKSEPFTDSAGKAADAATQTDDKQRRKRVVKEEEEKTPLVDQSTELSREEISPPHSSPSPESLQTLMKSDGSKGIIKESETHYQDQRVKIHHPSGKSKASTVLIQLISCGALTITDCSDIPATTTTSSMKNQRLSLIPQWKTRLPRVTWNHQHHREVALEDKEYFSGSLLIETKKKDEITGLKRSSSYNGDR